jgi:para-aminobenzoate synthetase component 1
VNFSFARSHAARRRIAMAPAMPFWRTVELFPPAGEVFLLDSALPDARLGRWSFAGGEPCAQLAGRRRREGDGRLDLTLTVWREPDGSRPHPPRRVTFDGDPWQALRLLRQAYGPATGPADDEAPFGGGLVGWFGYDAAWAVERLPWREDRAESAAPDLLFLACDDVLRHDHATGTTTLVATGRGCDPQEAERDLEARIAAWQARLGASPGRSDPADPATTVPPAPPTCDRAPDLSLVTAACDETAYREAVGRCRDHILTGDAFEICLTQQLAAPLDGDPWRLYGALRAVNPAPFAAFLRAGGVTVAGASPERFLSLDVDGRLESRPIKGTRPRGATPATDERLRRELADSPKDNAENTMIVDLVRSDLGRVARVGSVAVPDLRIVESYATVHQLVSTITAELKPELDALDAVRACFPGGSMTGAPKLEAMAIIEALEPAPRGVYAGALGWLGWDGAMDLSIIIRTFVCTEGRVTFGVGGAVTADSEPGAEYRETLDKARALLAALAAARGDLSEGEGA